MTNSAPIDQTTDFVNEYESVYQNMYAFVCIDRDEHTTYNAEELLLEVV